MSHKNQLIINYSIYYTNNCNIIINLLAIKVKFNNSMVFLFSCIRYNIISRFLMSILIMIY